jgi:hypothetical protein
MSFNLLPIARTVVMCCDVINTFDSANKVQMPSNTPVLDKIQLINRIVILGCVLTQVGTEINGASAKDLAMQKVVEIFPRMAEIGLRATKEAYVLGEEVQEGDQEINNIERNFRFFRKGFIAPTADFVRVLAEFCAYQEQGFLDLSPEEFAKTTRIIEIDENCHPIEVAPLNKEECIEDKATYEKVALVSSFLRAASETGVISQAAGREEDVYLRLALYFRALIGLADNLPARNLERLTHSGSRERQALEEIRQIIDFKGLVDIPLPLHQDVVFSRYVCPITRLPIRDPVGDPTNNHTLYERRAIIDWLRSCERRNSPLTSPVTNELITIETLVEKPALKLLIDHRLEHFQKVLSDYMDTPEFQANFVAAITPQQQALQDLADQENPNA